MFTLSGENRNAQVGAEPHWTGRNWKKAQAVCHMRYHRVLAVVLEGVCPAHLVGVAAGVANEGSRKAGWKRAGILDRAAECIAWMLAMALLKGTMGWPPPFLQRLAYRQRCHMHLCWDLAWSL